MLAYFDVSDKKIVIYFESSEFRKKPRLLHAIGSCGGKLRNEQI